MSLTYRSEQVQVLLDFAIGQQQHVSGNYTAKISDGLVVVDATTAQVDLPPLATAYDAELKVGTRIKIAKKKGSAFGIITVKGNAAELIETANTNTDVDTAEEVLEVEATPDYWKVI